MMLMVFSCALVDRDPREAVQVGQDVELLAGDKAEDRHNDSSDHGPNPDHEALLRAVEACHPAGNVAATVVGHEQDHQQGDDADESDCLVGAADGFVHIGVGGESHGGSGGGDERRQENGHARGSQPSEECRTDLNAAELFLFAGHHGLTGYGVRAHGIVADRVAADGVVADRFLSGPCPGAQCPAVRCRAAPLLALRR